MTFGEKQPVPSTDQVRRVLSEAAVLWSVTDEERDRIATDLSDAIVGALAHGATVHDLSNDFYSFLTVAYDLTVSVDECADLARQLIRLNNVSVERW